MLARLLTTLCLLAMNAPTYASDFSVKGVRLGMTTNEALAALVSDFQNSARKNKIEVVEGIIDERISAGAGECRSYYAVQNSSPCAEFSSILHKDGAATQEHRTLSVRFGQTFAAPIRLSVFEERILATYGAPQIRIPSTEVYLSGDVGEPTPEKSDKEGHGAWLWSDQPPKISREVLKFLLSDFPIPGDIGFTAPVLRIVYQVKSGLVFGISVHLFDPARSKERGKRISEAIGADSERRAKDAGAQINLR